MNANKINYYPNQIFDKYGLCMCGDCLSCRPDLFPIRNGENHICPDCYDGEYDEECAHCDCLCSDEYSGDVEGDADACICEDCFNNMEKCEMCGDPTDAEEWCDIERNVLYCSHCFNKMEERLARKELKASVAKAIAEAPDDSDDEVEEPKPSQMFQSILAEAVVKQDADAQPWWNKSAPVEPDEEFEAEVSNSHLLEVFGGEVVYNKVKELAKYPDLSSTLRVVWKFNPLRLSLYVYIEGEPFFDAVYPRNHSCDMFYMLEELKKEQEE